MHNRWEKREGNIWYEHFKNGADLPQTSNGIGMENNKERDKLSCLFVC